MRQLTGSDMYHFHEETEHRATHTLKVLVFDASEDPARMTPAAVRTWAAATLVRIEPFRWRLQRVPLGLARPVWVEVGELDLKYHLVTRTAPAPGDDAVLDEIVSDICSTRLDPRHPLWRLVMIDGLRDARVAFVLQLHHAVADGGATVRILEEMLGARPLPPARPPEPTPPRRQLLAVAARSQADLARRAPSQFRRFLAWQRASMQLKKSGDTPLPSPFAAPMTRFNRDPDTARICRFVVLSVEELKAVKDLRGGTLNDVFLAVCAGGLHRFLEETGELPDRPLITTAPVGLERDDPYGNATTTWYVDLHTHLADPVERYGAIRASVAANRHITELDARLTPDWQDYTTASRGVFLLLAAIERFARRPVYNLIVSNVRGPDHLSFDGIPLVELKSIGPLTGRFGLNLTGWSYGDAFTIGMHAYRAHLPDLDRLGPHLRAELDALLPP